MRIASWIVLVVVAGCASSGSSAVEHEREACAGVSDADRDLGPFAHADLIERVEPLLERAFAKAPANVPVGAIVYLRAAPGVTMEWLQRIIDCHLARHAAVGAAFHPACPMIAAELPRISVRSTGGGFAVSIRGSRLDADELLEHARALLKK